MYLSTWPAFLVVSLVLVWLPPLVKSTFLVSVSDFWPFKRKRDTPRIKSSKRHGGRPKSEMKSLGIWHNFLLLLFKWVWLLFDTVSFSLILLMTFKNSTRLVFRRNYFQTVAVFCYFSVVIFDWSLSLSIHLVSMVGITQQQQRRLLCTYTFGVY